jgi:diguanylate cyclase (GGDEF)-like protein
MDASSLFRDTLTGVYNRSAFIDRLSETLERQGVPISLLVVDLDNLFVINLERGRRAGDDALKALASTLYRSARTHDTVARLGGDQFAMLLPETTLDTAAQFARAVRSLVGRAHDVHPGLGVIDVCIGVASRPAHVALRAEELLEMGDLRLDSAKRSRHRPGSPCHIWSGPPDPLDQADD